MQPDPADQTGRLLPEGYLYARGDYVGRVDVSGAYSEDLEGLRSQIPKQWQKSFGDSCTMFSRDVYTIINDSGRIDRIARYIDNCKNGKCGDELFAGPNLKKQWKLALLSGRYFCANSIPTDWNNAVWLVDPEGMPLGTRSDGTIAKGDWARTVTIRGRLGRRQTLVGENSKQGCWDRELAHEALHGVIDAMPLSQLELEVPAGMRAKTWGDTLPGDGHSVIMGEDGLEMCIPCLQP